MTTEISWQQLRDQCLEETRRDRLRAKTPNQERYLEALEKSVITICVGPAGTGKTHLACGFAAKLLREGKVKRIVVTRPMVTCSGKQGKGMGFLPGDQKEKFSPYVRPLLDAFEFFFEPTQLKRYIDDETIEMWPLDMMRGASIKGAVVICDESQNCEFEQLYMFLTRLDVNSKFIITGDNTRKQTDLRISGDSPLNDVIRRFSPDCHKDVSIVRLGREDVCRPQLVQWVDERMSDEVMEEKWDALSCPKCFTTMWYDSDPEFIQCHQCATKIDLWDGEDFSPCVFKGNQSCKMTLPRKP